MTPPDSPLESLLVIDRLEVGPARIEPDKVTMPYRVTRGGVEDGIDFIYKFDEPVFDADDPGARNLAHMLGAQVAINYGLFCRSIAFNGLFDENDRRFILDMLENTCREIYVKKFLNPNPYLRGGAAGMTFEKRDRYLQAQVEFPNIPESGRRSRWKLWATDRDKHLVLSSGGKDSLLTYGLLNEMGKECYPVFANESGRHWFTALNAYRYFKEHVPGTARVWVNSDRVFAFMLRQLPFVRTDFADVRSDEYPIRLWTVAVFLFGVLPLMRKHGFGRVVIGDEYDTTNRMSYQGLTHYDGLFDQSRYFDNTLSQYYLRKGWSISQFSILRPLSELLIQKVLVERYPDLQAMQVSCHATHTEDGRVLPCGKCEKCRRIVAMLVAVDADPRRCGYTDAQIDACLEAVATQGIHQEAEGVAHLHYLLDQRGRVSFAPEKKKRLKPHPEVLSLRYDNRRSPLVGIPLDLRRPLIGIVLRHADGALLRNRRRWVEFDPLRDPGIESPYAYEVSTSRGGDDSRTSRMRPAAYLWGEMTWPEADEVFEHVDVAILPVGAIEQHGPHLPLDTDSFDADYMARRVAAACSDPKPLVLPLIPFGVSYHHEDFRGTVSVRNETLAQFVYDVGIGVARNGIRKLVILNGHGGNEPSLNHAAQMINRDTHIFVCVDTGETSDVDIYDIIDTPNDVHAGEIETSTSLAIRPHLVRTKALAKAVPSFSSRYLDLTSQRGVPWHAHTHKISSSGVMGDPTRATAEKGRRIWQIQIAHLVALVEDLKRMTLEEIYQRRY
jgi:creatinine amidohydrolase/Fe(II)-dependent formamide hydrolase-like protein